MSTLRHLVFFEFKPDVDATDIQALCTAFDALPAQIPDIDDYETGLNNSPEGLARGLTHAFQLTFASEQARDRYLEHPAHKAFQAVADPCLQQVLVFDYWARDTTS